jgi:hypothetical protein
VRAATSHTHTPSHSAAAMTDGKTDYNGMLAIVSEYVEFDFDAGDDEDFDEDEG